MHCCTASCTVACKALSFRTAPFYGGWLLLYRMQAVNFCLNLHAAGWSENCANPQKHNFKLKSAKAYFKVAAYSRLLYITRAVDFSKHEAGKSSTICCPAEPRLPGPPTTIFYDFKLTISPRPQHSEAARKNVRAPKRWKAAAQVNMDNVQHSITLAHVDVDGIFPGSFS